MTDKADMTDLNTPMLEEDLTPIEELQEQVTAPVKVEPEQKPFTLTKEQLEALKRSKPQIYEAITASTFSDRDEYPQVSFEKMPLELSKGESDKLRLTLPAMTHAQLNELIEKMLMLGVGEVDPRARTWVEKLEEGMAVLPSKGHGTAALTREGSDWKQFLSSTSGRSMNGRVTSVAKPRGGSDITGNAALDYLSSNNGGGRPSYFPLTSSGFWVSFNPASNLDWFYLHQTMIEKLGTIGRETVGVGYSSRKALILQDAIHFACSHIRATSVKEFGKYQDRTDILKFVDVNDIEAFLIGFLTACYPDGYPISVPCSNVGNCTASIDLDANLRIMTIFDNSLLSADQINHMAIHEAVGSTDLSAVVAYQLSLKGKKTKVVNLGKNIDGEETTVEFQPCSVHDYLESSRRHIEAIKTYISGKFDKGTSEEKRNQLERQFYQSVRLREYAHLVNRFMVATPDGRVIVEADPSAPDTKDSRHAIDEMLSRLTSSRSISKTFTEAAGAYQDDCLMTAVVLPKYECPSCGHQNHNGEFKGNFRECLVLDVPHVFLRLAVARVLQQFQ